MAVASCIAIESSTGPRPYGRSSRARGPGSVVIVLSSSVPFPVLAALAAFALGVGFVQTRAVLWPSGSCAGAALAIVALALCASKRRGVRVALWIAVAASVGLSYATWRGESRLANALPAEWEGVDIAVVGIVDDLPRLADRTTRFAFAVEQVLTPRAVVPRRLSLAWQNASEDVEVPSAPRVRAGERWSLVIRLRRPHGTMNPGGFDVEAWLFERNLRATGYVRADDSSRRIDAFAGRLADRVQRVRESIRDAAAAALPDAPQRPVLVALAIGDQSGLPESAWRVFNRTGTGHLISVSGLHVTVFAVLVGGLAFAIARRSAALTSRVAARKVAAVFGLAASFVYVLIAGAEVPAVRTLLMLAVAAAGLWLGRPGTGLVVWTWALVAVLLLDPWAIVAAGFWLSFFAVGVLIYAGSGRRPDASRARWHQRMVERLREAARSQWAITLGLVPLSLALFQQVSLIGPVANAVAIPAVTFAIVPLTLAAAVLPHTLPWQLAHAMLEPLVAFLAFLAALPSAAWTQHEPPLWAIVLGTAGVALCLAPRGIPGRWLGVFAVAPLFAAWPVPPAPGTFRLAILDVGQGTAVVVQTHRHALLYDTGPRWTDVADAGGRVVAPYLRAAGIRRLDAMIVSHRDLDHAGGALSVLDAVPVGFLISSLDEGHEIVSRNAERALHLRCRNGLRWEWDGVGFELLFPESMHYDDPWRKSNDLSCVLRVSAGERRALLTGDIEAKSEIELVIERPERLHADVLVVPHHGSRTSSTTSFVSAVAPLHAVFTVGYRNRFGHPRADIVARYTARGVHVHRSDTSGTLTFALAPDATGPPHAAREARRRYWHDTS